MKTIRILALVIIAFALSTACHARALVGLYPFETRGSGFAYLLPDIIGWELVFVPGIDRGSLAGSMICARLDGLARPKSLDDVDGYANFARELGFEYLVTGRIDKQDDSSVRFKVIVYCAKSSRIVYRSSYKSKDADLLITSAEIARKIASALGISVGDNVRFDLSSMNVGALAAADGLIRLRYSPDTSYSAIYSAQMDLYSQIKRSQSGPYLWYVDASIPVSSLSEMDNLDNVRRKAPGNIRLLREAIEGYCEIGAIEKASENCEKLLALDPASPYYRVLSKAVQARVIRKRSPKQQITISALPVPEKTWRAELIMLSALSLSPNINDIDSLVKSVETQRRNSAYAWVVIGDIYSSRSKHSTAATKYRRALSLKPNSMGLHARLCAACLSAGDFDSALIVARKATKRWPSRADSHLMAGRVYLRMGRADLAQGEFETVRSIDPENYYARHYLGLEYMRTGRVMEAAREFLKTEQQMRRSVVTTMLVLTVIFVLGIIGIAIVVKVMLAPDRGRNA